MNTATLANPTTHEFKKHVIQTPAVPFLSAQTNHIVFVPGAFSTNVDQFASWKKSAMIPTDTVCLQGHGDEDAQKGVSGRSMKEYVYGLSTSIRDLKDKFHENNPSRHLGKTILISHSMGGPISQIYANTHRHEIAGVVLLASSAPGYIGGLANANKCFHLQANLKMSKPRYGLAMLTGNPFRLTPGDEKFLAGDADVKFGWESGLAFRELVLGTHAVAPITCPVLIVTPTHDQTLKPYIGEALAEFHAINPKNAHIIEEGGHMFHMTNKDLPGKVFTWINDNCK